MDMTKRNVLAGALIFFVILVSGAFQVRAESDIATLKKAAEQGNAVAQSSLAAHYVNGIGVQQDDKQGFAWYRKAAEQGNAEAQFIIGDMYVKGKGVPQDVKQGFSWNLKAAEQGIAEAQRILGIMYAKGEGVPRNNVKAYAWSSLAAAQGDEDGKNNSEIIANNFTPDQLRLAKALTAELQGKTDKKKPALSK